MADLDDQSAESSELDLTDDAAITGNDVEEVLGVDEGSSAVMPRPDTEPSVEDEAAAD